MPLRVRLGPLCFYSHLMIPTRSRLKIGGLLIPCSPAGRHNFVTIDGYTIALSIVN